MIKKLENKELVKCVGGKGGYNCYKFGHDVGRAVGFLAPIIIPLCLYRK